MLLLPLIVACGGEETAEAQGDVQQGGGQEETTSAPVVDDRGNWRTGASLTVPVSEIAAAELDGKIYVLGGYTAETTTSTFNQVYDPATNTWEELAPMPRGLNHVGATGYDGKIYAIGGFAGGDVGAVASFYAYDVATDVWEELAPLPTPRGSVAVARLGNRIHAIGRRDVLDVNTHEAYDPATGM